MQENGIMKKQQYGIIKLIADKNEYRVNASTIERLKNLPPNFKGTVTITELNVTVSPSQICFMEIREEKKLCQKDFMHLPTQDVYFTSKGEMITGMTERQIQKSGVPYYRAECHYREESNGEKSFLIKRGEMPLLLLMTPVPKEPEYPFQVSGIWHYGVQQQW